MSHIDMTLLAAECFLNDGRLNANELDKLLALAEADQKITEEEIAVLQSVINRIRPEEIDSAMQSRLNALQQVLGITYDPKD